MSFTPEALIEQRVIQFEFPQLQDVYNPFMGNFQFNPVEFRQKIRYIQRWMQTFEGYRVVHEEGYFYLTNF
jgi:hypothetical protein